eukprot:756482-Hanusia_phi.AAC.7
MSMCHLAIRSATNRQRNRSTSSWKTPSVVTIRSSEEGPFERFRGYMLSLRRMQGDRMILCNDDRGSN